jgi:transposase InsO family protein
MYSFKSMVTQRPDSGVTVKHEPGVCSPLRADDVQEFVPGEPWIPRGATNLGSKLSVASDSRHAGDALGLRAAVEGNAPDVGNVAIMPSSLSLRGYIENSSIEFVIDTGAEVTVVNQEVLTTLPRSWQEEFAGRSTTLHSADGRTFESKGPVFVHIRVNNHTVLEAVYAADIAKEALLGLPTLRALGLYLSVAGETVVGNRGRRSRRVEENFGGEVVAECACTIPPFSEVVTIGRVRNLGRGAHDEPVMVGPVREGMDAPERVMVAKAVVTPEAGLCPVRLVNVTDEPVLICKGKILANAEGVEVVPDSVGAVNRVVGPDEALPENVRSLFESTIEREDLSKGAVDGLRALLIRHANLFARDDKDLGRTDLVEHDIDTGDATPIHQPPRRVPEALKNQVEMEIQSMLEKGVIERGQSPWSSPVVLVRKKDGSLRFCVDYRRLNAVTKFDAYPLPRIDETLEALSGARYFTTLDLISGYWQVGLSESAKLKSAFVVRSGLYLFKVMPFGLSGAPATFERLMETVLRGLQWESCLVYLDDVVIFGRTETELLSRMDEVFARLGNANLKLKPKKCKLFARETDYLGHVISGDGIAVSPDKIAAIREWPVPKNVTDVRSFLGTASYYRRFVPNFSTVASPLSKLTAKGVAFDWTPACQASFEQLKGCLSTTPVLGFPVPGAPYILDTDASLTGIGAVLSQVVDGEERVLGYASRTLSKCEQNYCVTRRELLAVVKFVQHFRPYLYGREFTVRTDHASLQWLVNFKEPEGQIARWLQSLSEYQYKMVHRPGKQHGNADGLSRQQCRQCRRTECEGSSNTAEENLGVGLLGLQPEWTNQKLSEAQQADPDIGPVYRAFQAGKRPESNAVTTWTRAAKRYLAEWDSLRMEVDDQILRRAWFDNLGNESKQLLIVPRTLVGRILEYAHDNPMAGHFSERRTLARVKEHYFWSGLTDDVKRWYRGCEVCGARKPKPSRPHHAMQAQVVSEPLERVAVDILGPLDPPTPRGNRYVLVVVDYLTKWAEAYAMKTQTAEECANHFVREFVCRFGMPRQLHSDQGRQFESDLWQQMCAMLNIHKTRTTPGHPQSDGQTERMNRTLLDVLAKLTRDKQTDWDLHLDMAMAAYRGSVHKTTEFTPARLMLGREMNTPTTLLVPPPPGAEAKVPWAETLHKRFRDTHELVVETTKARQGKVKMYADRRHKGYQFQAGDSAWFYNPRARPGFTHKLDANRWVLCEVIRKLTDCLYVILPDGSRNTKVVNVDRLAPYYDRNPDQFPPAPVYDDDDRETVDSFDSDQGGLPSDEFEGPLERRFDPIYEDNGDGVPLNVGHEVEVGTDSFQEPAIPDHAYFHGFKNHVDDDQDRESVPSWLNDHGGYVLPSVCRLFML